MREVPNYISGHEQVVEAYGYWPSFHDSPVLAFTRTPECIELHVEAWEMTREVDSRGYFVLTKKHEIGFRFSGIASAELDDFIPNNILFELAFSPVAHQQTTGQFQVDLDSAMGGDMCGQFTATSGEVLYIRPSPMKPPAETTACFKAIKDGDSLAQRKRAFDAPFTNAGRIRPQGSPIAFRDLNHDTYPPRMKLTSVLLLLSLASACLLNAADDAATKPKEPKPLRSYQDFLAVIPKDMEPENARNWTDAQKEVANGLLKKKLVDTKRPAKMRFKVRGVDFWERFVVWSYLPNDEGYYVRAFASQWKDDNMLPKLATLREGDLIEMSGVCDLAKFENLWNTKSLSLGIGDASFIKLLPNGKPAPTPERIPVKLISAVYGSGTAFTDVTDRVKALLDEPGANFYANPNWLGADPTPGWNKALIIVHESDDKRRTFIAGENGEVSAALIVK